MRALTFIVFLLAFEAAFPFCVEVRASSENALENQTEPKSSEVDPIRRKLLTVASQTKGNDDITEPGSGTGAGTDVITQPYMARNVRQEFHRFYPALDLVSSFRKMGGNLFKKASGSDGKRDDSVPFWAARG